MLRPVKVSELPEDTQKRLVHRLSRIEGHVRAVKRMLEEGQSCNDVLLQLAAIASAVGKVEAELLKAHLTSCVLGEDRERDVQELLKAIDRLF